MVPRMSALALALFNAAAAAPSAPAAPRAAAAQWIHGAMMPVAGGGDQTVCATSNGCGAFMNLACADASQVITNITFASYGNPAECPAPATGSCSHPDSLKVASASCLHKTNCSVDKGAFKTPLSCDSKIGNGQERFIITATCGSGATRRANLLRYEFRLPGGAAAVRAAEANVSAIGYHTLWCNGARVSARLMQPGRTSARSVFFSRFDLAPHLRTGRNVLAAALGNGWEASSGNQPGAIQQPPALHLTAAITLGGAVAVAAGGVEGRGAVVRLVSNESWSSGLGVVTYDSVYQGERRDMRVGATAGAASVSSFDGTAWRLAVVGRTDKVLVEQTRPAVVELMVLKPTTVVEIDVWAPPPAPSPPPADRAFSVDNVDNKKTFLVDFGQNLAGVVRLRPPRQPGPGQVITIRHCEVLQHPPLSAAPVGRRGCYYGELVNAANVDVYTLSADPSKNGEWLQPDFTIHGFRHVEISGLDALGPEVSHGLQLQSIWIVPTAAVS